MRILIAEDQKDLNKILKKKLQAEGYTVDACFNGEEALDFLAAGTYDGAVLDINMPTFRRFPYAEKRRLHARFIFDCARYGFRSGNRP